MPSKTGVQSGLFLAMVVFLIVFACLKQTNDDGSNNDIKLVFAGLGFGCLALLLASYFYNPNPYAY